MLTLPLDTWGTLAALKMWAGETDAKGWTRLAYKEDDVVVFESERFVAGQLLNERLRDIVNNFVQAVLVHTEARRTGNGSPAVLGYNTRYFRMSGATSVFRHDKDWANKNLSGADLEVFNRIANMF